MSCRPFLMLHSPVNILLEVPIIFLVLPPSYSSGQCVPVTKDLSSKNSLRVLHYLQKKHNMMKRKEHTWGSMQAWIWILVCYQLALGKFLCLAFSVSLGGIEKNTTICDCENLMRESMQNAWHILGIQRMTDGLSFSSRSSMICQFTFAISAYHYYLMCSSQAELYLSSSCLKCPSSLITDILYQLCSNATHPSKLWNIVSLFSNLHP